jgi:hypothetical protein
MFVEPQHQFRRGEIIDSPQADDESARASVQESVSEPSQLQATESSTNA